MLAACAACVLSVCVVSAWVCTCMRVRACVRVCGECMGVHVHV